MSRGRCSMLDRKQKNIHRVIPAKDGISASLQQVSSIKHPVSCIRLYHMGLKKIDIHFIIFVYADG